MSIVSSVYFLVKMGLICIAVSLCHVVIGTFMSIVFPQTKPFFMAIRSHKLLHIFMGWIESVTIGSLLYMGLPLYGIVTITLAVSYVMRGILAFWQTKNYSF